MTQIWVGLGSNLDNPIVQIKDAIEAFRSSECFTCVQVSSLYGSSPMGPQDQPDYVNAVLGARTSLEPLAVLDALQAIENDQGRERKRHWGERTLDLDLLLYGEEMIETPRLTVPHVGIADRDFVLKPLLEVAGDIQIPNKGLVSQCLKQCQQFDLHRLDLGETA